MFKGLFDNVQWAGILSLLIFFGVFVIAMVFVALKKKTEMDYMSKLPLQDDDSVSGEEDGSGLAH